MLLSAVMTVSSIDCSFYFYNITAAHGVIIKSLPWTVNFAGTLSLKPTIFWAIHWYLPSSIVWTLLISKLPPSIIRKRLFVRPRMSSKSIVTPSWKNYQLSQFNMRYKYLLSYLSPFHFRLGISLRRSAF